MAEVTTQAKVEEGELQKEDVVTQEPTSSRVVVEVIMQEETAKTLIKEDVVTQEPTSPRVVVEVPMQGETIETLIEEAVTLPVQNVQAETSDGKVYTQFSQNFVNMDSDDEENVGDERVHGLIKEFSLLKMEVKKWKRQVDNY